MVSIFSGLGTARDALAGQQLALEITQRNIANVNTPGYTRQRVVFSPVDYWDRTTADLTTGAPFFSIESFRDRFMEYRISEELQGQGEFEASSSALGQIEVLLNENSGQGLQTELSNFFNSFSALANAPEDMTLRQQVLYRASELSAGFRRLYDRIQAVQVAQDRSVADTVKEINILTGKLARLNPTVGAAQTAHLPEESSLRDERVQLLEKLSSLIDISSFETESGTLTITTRAGVALVVGDQSKSLQTGTAGAFLQVQLDGQDITSKIESGKLGGLIKMRDATLPGYLSKLDDLAAGLIARVNAQHSQGSDYDGTAGGNFFAPFTPGTGGSTAGAARALSLAISDPKKIAAASLGGGVGSNANARLLAGIGDEKLFESGSSSASQFYAHLIFNVGADMHTADENLKTQEQVLLQLNNKRDSLVGVNMDEEAVNIIRYQKAYEASARMVQVWDSLAEETINLLGK